MKTAPPQTRTTNVTKIVIVPFMDKEMTIKDPNAEEYVIPVNPESYSQNYKVDYDVRRGQGQQRTEAIFKSTAPEELKLDFVLDGTGTIQQYFNAGEPVEDQVRKLLNTVYDMSHEIHMPRYLKLYWGQKFMIQCVLTNLDINYTLFNEAGKPLRAKISATFLDHIAKTQRVAREGKRSPDLTHVRVTEEDDRLDLLTYEIYNDSKYFIEVAAANNLKRLRNIPAGLKLNFPPFDKTAP